MVWQAIVKEIHFYLGIDCTNIVTIRGILIENEIPSIVMEWAPDGSLDKYLENCDGRYDDLEIVSIVD